MGYWISITIGLAVVSKLMQVRPRTYWKEEIYMATAETMDLDQPD
jgi:hypothetical protein